MYLFNPFSHSGHCIGQPSEISILDLRRDHQKNITEVVKKHLQATCIWN